MCVSKIHFCIISIIITCVSMVAPIASAYGPLSDINGYEAYWYQYSGYTYPYRLLYPHNYDANESYPLFVVVPGQGELGDENIYHVTNGTAFPSYIKGGSSPSANYTDSNYKCFVLSFQCPNIVDINSPYNDMTNPDYSEPIDTNSNYYPGENGERLVWSDRPWGWGEGQWPLTFRQASHIGYFEQDLYQDSVSVAACCGLVSAIIHDANFTWFTKSDISSSDTKTGNRVVNVDPNRVYIGGHSWGSIFTWQCLATNAHLWAAAMPGDGAIAYHQYIGLNDSEWWTVQSENTMKYRLMIKRLLERSKHIPVLQYVVTSSEHGAWPPMMGGCHEYRNSLNDAADFLYNEGYYIDSTYYTDYHNGSTKRLLNDGVLSGSYIWTVRVSEANQVSALRTETEDVNDGILRPLTWLFQQSKEGRTWEDDPYPTPYLDAEPEDIPLDYVHDDHYLKWWRTKPMRYRFVDANSRAWADINDVIYEVVEDGNDLIWDKGKAGEHTFGDVNEIITPVSGPNGFRVQYEGAFESAGNRVYHAFALLLPYDPNEPNEVDKRATNASPEIEEMKTNYYGNTLELSWTAGPGAVSHNVYFGLDYDSIIDANTSSSEFMGNQESTIYSLDSNDLVFERTHYWRIDEVDVNDNKAKGRIWRFFYENGCVRNLSSGKIYSSFQEGINDANNGDTLEARTGSHSLASAVDFGGKSVTLRSSNPSDWNVVSNTIIVPNDSQSTSVRFISGEDSNSVLAGFTITGSCSGSAIVCGAYGSPESEDSDPTISNCIITDNGVGIYCYKSSPTIINNKIAYNSSFGVSCYHSKTPIIKNNWIYGMTNTDATGIGFDYASSVAEVCNNTIANNDFGIYGFEGVDPNIVNCILWDNIDSDLWRDSNSLSTSYSCVQDGAPGTGNITGDANNPAFIDPNNDNYHLTLNSPCRNAGDPNGGYSGQTDIDGDQRVEDSYVDMGADEIGGCYTGPEYDQWILVDVPEGWCSSNIPRQCHGDTDNAAQSKQSYWVSTADLDVLLEAWNKPFADIAGQTHNGTPLINADFDHKAYGKNGYRVSSPDLDILLTNWNIANKPDPNCP